VADGWVADGVSAAAFLVNNHKAAEAALGREVYRGILRAATDKSAYDWCVAEAGTHGLAPEDTVRHYFKRLSQRGWGIFTIEALGVRPLGMAVRLAHSVFVLESHGVFEGPVCYMFEGFVTGALRYLGGGAVVACGEDFCAADGVHECCRFAAG
jgi:predicted hydrocarbon binding protein